MDSLKIRHCRNKTSLSEQAFFGNLIIAFCCPDSGNKHSSYEARIVVPSVYMDITYLKKLRYNNKKEKYRNVQNEIDLHIYTFGYPNSP